MNFRRRLTHLCAAGLLLMLPFFQPLFAQTTLATGDISIIGFNAALTNRDGLAFVTWVPISTNTVIKFTDAGFNGTSSSATGALRDLEETITWTATSNLPAGTVVTIEGNGSATVASTGTITVLTSSNSTATYINLGTTGDQLFALQGSYASANSAAATFTGTALFGVSYQGLGSATTWNSSGTTAANTSYLPTELASASIFFNSSIVAGQYTGTRTGLTIAQYKAAVNNIGNWTTYTNPSGVTTYSTSAFAIPAPPAITANPSGSSICAGTNTSFAVTATGATSYQWQVNTGAGFSNITNGAPYSGATTNTLQLTAATAAMSGYAYRVVVTGATAPVATSSSATLTVNSAPSISAQPSSAGICSGTNTSFAVTASNVSTYQWQVNTGSGYANITNGGVYSGATTSTLTITAATANMTGYLYKCVIAGSCTPNATSNAATLTVTASGQWLGSSNSNWSNTANWSCGTLPGPSTNVTIASSASFMPVVDITTATCNDITLGGGSSLTVNAGKILDIKGAITNSGTFTSNGKAVFSGAGQTIPALTYYDLEVSGTGNKTLAGSTTVTHQLTLTNSFIILGTADLLLGNTAIISGGSSSSFVVTGSSGKLKQNNIGTGGKSTYALFPVGNSTGSYTPVGVLNAGTPDQFGARIGNVVSSSYTAGDVPSGAPQNSFNVGRTWYITEAVAGGSNVTLTFQWNAGDENTGFDRLHCFGAHYTGNAWTHGPFNQAASGTNPYSLSLTGITTFSPFGVGSSGSVLPVHLISFTGKRIASGASLEWKADNEVNLANYTIEQSEDGVAFIGVGKVAALNQAGIMSYTFPIPYAANKNIYFRLRQNDIDGKFTYSSIIVLTPDNARSVIQLFPNPTTGSSNLVMTLNQRTTVNFKIVNGTGTVIRSWQKTLGAGEHQETIEFYGLAAGMYYVEVNGENYSQKIKVIRN